MAETLEETESLPGKQEISLSADEEILKSRWAGALEGERWFAEKVRKRLIEENRNLIAVWLGETGVGKSYATLRAAWLIDPRFSLTRLVFDVPMFLDLIDRSPPSGSVIVWDELGKGLSAREWASEFNKAASLVLQTFRYRNYALLTSVPDPEFVDRIPRTLFHYWFETTRVDYKKKVVVTRPYRVQRNPRLGKTYTPHPTMDGPEGPIKIRSLRFKKPPEALVKGYEERRVRYMDAFYAELRKRTSPINVRRECAERALTLGLTQRETGFIVERSDRTIRDWLASGKIHRPLSVKSEEDAQGDRS